MTTKYHVTFVGWLTVNASTPEEAIEITHRIIDPTGAKILVDEVEEDY